MSFNIITFLFIYYKIHPTDATLALHYNVLSGVDLYGKGITLYNIPAAGLAIAVANFIFFRMIKNEQRFLSFLSAFVSAGVQIVLLAAVLFISRFS